MARGDIREIDEFFFLDIILIFLMINYSLPLATIYLAMVLVGSLMYLVPIYSNLFRWIPFQKKEGSMLTKIAWGVGAGVAFIYLYNYVLSSETLGRVFAATAFGESELIGKLTFGVLIAIVETRFFFRSIMQWWAWKINQPTNISPFSVGGIKLMVFFGAIFAIFHATAKGVSNNMELMLTFAFGMVSVAMILYFQEVIQAAIMHVVVNAKGVSLVDSFIAGGFSLMNIIIVGVVVLYLSSTARRKLVSVLPFT